MVNYINNLLNEVEIIVRYSRIEEPYWLAFINHHYSLGVKKIRVLIRDNIDIFSLESFSYPGDLNIYIHKYSSEIDPNKALINFEIAKFKYSSRYKLMIDCDEFVYSFKKDLDISKLGKNCSLDLRWVQNPLTNKIFLNKGFYGCSTKPLAKSSQISSIKGCHSFNFIKQRNSINRNEAIKYGLVLIHHCSRSLIDCLLRSCYSRINNLKTADKETLVTNLQKGILNNRTKYLAFLDIQNRYVTGINSKYVEYFNYEKEQELILEKVSESDVNLYIELYEEWKRKLLRNQEHLEHYPPYKGNTLKQMDRLFRAESKFEDKI